MKLKIQNKSTRQRIVDKISAIIKSVGKSVTTQDLQLDTSPVYKNLSHNRIMLIERFNEDDVDVITYFKDEKFDEDSIEYKDLTVNMLKGILEHLKEYVEQQEIDWEKTLKRCSN